MQYTIKFTDGTTKKINSEDINKIKRYINDNIGSIISFNRTTSRKDWDNIDNLSDEDQIFMLMKKPYEFWRIENPSEKVQLKAVELIAKRALQFLPDEILQSEADLSPKTIEAIIDAFNNEKGYRLISEKDFLKGDLRYLYKLYSNVISSEYKKIFTNNLLPYIEED